MIEKISDKELHMITTYRHAVGDDTDNDFFIGEYCSTNDWLFHWEQNKQWMEPVFKNSLILKKRITSSIPDNELFYNLHDNLLNTSIGKCVKYRIINYISEYSNYAKIVNPEGYYLKDFIESQIEANFFTSGALADNIYNGCNFEITPKESLRPLKVVKGCKIMKILGKIAAYAECLTEFEEFRLIHSRIMNQANLQSNLCISIHPLDYMTASVNENDWRSCMHWEDGEYRRGVIEMMNSPCVVVAYLESDHEHLQNYNCDWNSKKWREFFIVDENFISGIKGYPYWNRDLETTTLLWLKELFTPIVSNYGKEFSNNIIQWDFGTKAIDKGANSSVHFDFDCGPAMYDDFYGDNYYLSILTKDFNPEGSFEYNYSGPSICVVCGNEGDFDSEGSLCCEDCIEKYYCCKCGDLVYRKEDLIKYNGRYYCYYCFQELPECDFCEDTIDPDNDNVFEFYVSKADLNVNYNYSSEDFYESEDIILPQDHCAYKACECCVNKIFKDGNQEWYKPHANYRHFYQRIPIVNIKDLADCAFDFIDIDKEENEN